MNADLSGLTIGSLTLSPSFSAEVTEYTATTTNSTNTVTATAKDENTVITILNGGTEVENGTPATWADGENTLTVTAENGSIRKVYTVTVTKS